MLPNQDSSAASMAREWLKAFFRFVKRTIRKNANTGGSGRSQMIDSVVIDLLLHETQIY
jgi:hypothetical protein